MFFFERPIIRTAMYKRYINAIIIIIIIIIIMGRIPIQVRS